MSSIVINRRQIRDLHYIWLTDWKTKDNDGFPRILPSTRYFGDEATARKYGLILKREQTVDKVQFQTWPEVRVFDKQDETKQVIVMRKDLKMNRGKIAAQAAHASMLAYLDNVNDPSVHEWLMRSFTKVTCRVDSLEALHEVLERRAVVERMLGVNIPWSVITDEGRTTFKEPTRTCIAIGPVPNFILEHITGNKRHGGRLQLYA